MATTKKRINITASPDIESALLRSAKQARVSVSSRAVALIRIALELEEDIALASIAEARMKQKAKFISHESFWK